MYEISKENLKANGFKSKISKADFSEFTKMQDKFDAIVTDLPYGIASKASEDPQELIKKFVSMLPRRKKIAIMCKKGFEKKLNMNPSKTYDIYRHKSLTRTILIK
jgi:tRNA (guanine10-N2)-dimethyltransferase